MTIIQALLHEEVMAGLLQNAHILILLVLVAISLTSLSKGADWMVDGVVALAKKSGMPKIIIGATIVSLGTTLPETFVSVFAAFSGNASLALGNGVGSIIADTGLIFGLAIILAKVPMNNYIMNRSGRWQVGAATLLVVVAFAMLIVHPGNPTINVWIGALFMLMLVTYLTMSYRWAKEADSDFDEDDEENMGNVKITVLIVVGIFFVILGAKILIPSVSEVAVRMGVPSDIIAATMVAFGTSLPELITALSAIRKGHPEIIIGNVIGADVLNCLLVIGASSIAAPLHIAQNFYFLHFPVMLLILFSLRIFYHRNKSKQYFSKSIGVWMLLLYVAYITIQYTVL